MILMEELYEAIINLGKVAGELGLTVEEFCDYLQKLATEPIEEQEQEQELQIGSFKNG